MNKKYFLITLVILLVFISSCGGSGRGSGTSISDVDVRKGFDSLSVEFLKNSPPESVYEDSPFPLVLKVWNKGADNIGTNQGALAIGFEKDYVNLNLENFESSERFSPQAEKDRIRFSLEGRSIRNPIGEQEILELSLNTKSVGAQSETRTSNLFVTACYDYGTVLGTEICVDTDINNINPGRKACSAQDKVFAQGQGSPVAITKIETKMLPDVDNNRIKPHFIIHIENKGNGEVIKPGSFDIVCSSEGISFKEFNLVEVKAALSEQILRCTSPFTDEEGTFAKLRDKKSMVRCTLEQGIDRNLDSYTTPLLVELDYGYTFTVSKEFTIEKIIEY